MVLLCYSCLVGFHPSGEGARFPTSVSHSGEGCKVDACAGRVHTMEGRHWSQLEFVTDFGRCLFHASVCKIAPVRPLRDRGRTRRYRATLFSLPDYLLL